MIQIAKVRKNPMQPRREFDDAALASLAHSLKAKGALQPILVRPAEGGYELVAGERRLRAAGLAGLTELPAIVRAVKDDELLELALIENIQREDLNPIERAKAYHLLSQKYGLTHDAIADRVGEDRATVSNYLRILALDDEIQGLIGAGELSTGHAKAILGITDKAVQLQVARAVVKGRWSVRQAEAAAAKTKTGSRLASAIEARPAVKDVEQRLSTSLGMRVRIQEGRRKHAGRLVIEYYNLDDFERVTSLLGVVRESA
jgi:ParB family chromosome partitioning protein